MVASIYFASHSTLETRSNTPMSTIQLLHSGKILGLPDGNVLSCCPKMDLLAISMNKTSIWMFRYNGERVYSINNKAQVLDLQWNLSGRFFAVSGTDNYINIYETNSGVLVNKFATNSSLPITLISWSSVSMNISIGSDEAMRYINMFKQDILKDLPKLSHEVNFYDTERAGGIISLHDTPPKAQSMSVSATNTNEDDSSLDYLLVVNANSLLSATFNNLFAIPGIELPENCKYIKHEVRQDFFTQYFLAEESLDRLAVYKMVLDIPTPRQKSYVLDILKWSSLIISMLNHITDQVSNMQHEASQFLSFFDRHLGNLKDAIAEGHKTDENNNENEEVEVTEDELVETVMEIMMTGFIPPNLKDYWLNQFGERGLMKLSKMGNELFDGTRKTAYAQIILAIEKLIILLSDLRGVCLAAQNIYEDPIGMNVSTIENAVELSKALLIKVYKFIVEMNKEQESFNIFCRFVKVEIVERLSKGESDWELFIKAHPDIEVSTSKAMNYADKHMMTPIFVSYLKVDTSSYEAISNQKEGDDSIVTALITLKSEINERLLDGIQKYLAGKAKFDLMGSVAETVEDGESDMIQTGEKILVVKASESKITFSFIANDGKTLSSFMLFPLSILAFRLTNDMRVVALLKGLDGTSELALFDVPEPGSKTEYGNMGEDQVKAVTLTHSLTDPAIMRITKDPFSNAVSGCIFDKTKRSYIIFKI